MTAEPPGALLDPATIQDPYPFLAWMREHEPVWRVPDTPLALVTTWDLALEVLGRPDDFSSNLNALVYTGENRGPALFDMTVLGTNIQTLATADPPMHTDHRRTVFPSLVEREMAGVAPRAQALAADFLASALGRTSESGALEITAALANPLPMAVLVEVMGFDDPDLDTLLAWAFAGTELLAGTNTLEQMGALTLISAEAGEFLARRLTAADPDRGVLGAVARGVRDGMLSPEEGVSTLVILLGAGGESTASLIGNAVRVLAEDSELQAALRADRELVELLVEEVLRTESPFRGHFRSVRRTTTLGGTELDAGDTLFVMWSAANRDPAHYVAPDTIDLFHDRPRDHLGFGRGIHHCVGAPLARMEAHVAIETLLDQTHHISLDTANPPAYVNSIFVRRHEHLTLLVDAR